MGFLVGQRPQLPIFLFALSLTRTPVYRLMYFNRLFSVLINESSKSLKLKTQYCLCLHRSEASIVFRGFAVLAASIQLRGKKLLRLVPLVSLNLLY